MILKALGIDWTNLIPFVIIGGILYYGYYYKNEFESEKAKRIKAESVAYSAQETAKYALESIEDFKESQRRLNRIEGEHNENKNIIDKPVTINGI